LGDAKDLGRWIPFLQEMVDGNVGIVRLDAVQLLVKRFPVALRRGCHRSPVSDDGRHRDMQDDQPSPVISGQRTGQVKRVFGKRGKISRMQDRRETKHGIIASMSSPLISGFQSR
jgi:hypothetical protein